MSIKKIRTAGTGFVTSDGQPFIARGLNMVCKDKFLDYIGDYSPEDFRFLRENGFNLIRLGIFWDGAEPMPGVYNDEYFMRLDRIIEMAASEGIAVFLDMHQDLYGVVFEDGAPAWATITDNCEHIRTELWSESYLASPAVQHAFDNFWHNAPAPDGVGIRTHYVNLWKHIAEHFGSNPYVIGYDIMNEPFPGTPGAQVAEILGNLSAAQSTDPGTDGTDHETGSACESSSASPFDDPETIAEIVGQIMPITAAFEEEFLNPFYDEVARAIRSVDSETLIFIESNYFANAGIPSAIRPPMNPDGSVIPGIVYAPHGYDIMVDTDAYDEGGTDRVAFIFGSLFETAKRLELPTLIGEWGCYPNATPAQKAQAEFLLGMFKEAGIGNVYYDFSHIRTGILEVLSK
ncbi:MAG: cellulase family glycosylhydrolase [Lachnospiraceae bacterium]|nr:cellulase family glycosylhydrolase [Lachnospiraceae bacterium]